MGELNVKKGDTHDTPSSGYQKLYPKTDSKWYSKTEAGAESELGSGATPGPHASAHVNGTDDIQNATDSQKGLATAAQISKLNGIEPGADVTDAGNVAGAGAEMVANKNATNGYAGLSGGKLSGTQQVYGSGSNTSCEGNDARLSNARTPTAHASSHQSGGGDAIKLDDLAAPDDNTDLNASTSKHGLLPKLNDLATQFLNGQGVWATPSGGGITSVSVTLADEEYYDLPNATQGLAYLAFGDGEGYSLFSWSTAGVPTNILSSGWVTFNTVDGYFNIWDNGTNVRIKNRRGASRHLVMIYFNS